MLHRTGEFDELHLAEEARKYIGMYRRGEVCYVPYMDLPSNKKKYVKFILVNNQWVYVGNSQY